ncbi:membrane dipeptidase, partial [Pseudomonas sp. 5S3]|nr:membrane dipeptidase [Pseudomonas sp. 5S3]
MCIRDSKELQLIKNSGGVVQVVGFPAYLRPLSQPTQDKLNTCLLYTSSMAASG